MAGLALYFLGSPRLERDGAVVQVDTRKAVALLAYLAVTRHEHGRDTLAALLWPEYDQQHARGALRRTLSALRGALGGEWLAVTQEGIGLNWDAGPWIDVDQFTRLATIGRSGASAPVGGRASLDDAALMAELAAAAELYRDDFLAGFSLRDSAAFDDWQFMQSEGLRRDFATLLERLVRGFAALGAAEQAIVYARRWLALDPLEEPVHRILMQLYAATGQRSSALRQYQECVRILQQELGVAPLGETTLLYQQIKEQRPGAVLAPVLRAAGGPAASASAGDTAPPEAGSHALQHPGAAGPSLHAGRRFPGGAPLPFVGRDAEWGTLLQVYSASAAAGQLVVLEGEAGIGKTRLAEELLAVAARQGACVVAARCYQGEAGLAYAPFVDALRTLSGTGHLSKTAGLADEDLIEAGRLLPVLREPGQPGPAPLDGPGAQERFFASVTRVLAAACRPGGGSGTGEAVKGSPGLLFLDDVQWMDPASLDLLVYLARRLAPAGGDRRSSSGLCLLLAWRTDALAPGHPLRRLLAEGLRAGYATHVPLRRLSEQALGSLVESMSPQLSVVTGRPEDQPARRLVNRLYRETEGLPYFLAEYLAALAEGTLGSDGGSWTTPNGVRDLVHTRLAGVSEAGRQLLSAAAVIGRSFDFDTLREVSGRAEEETVDGLEELLAQGLVRELAGGEGIPVYDFEHEKLRALVYEEASLARRRLLHRRAAEALAGQLRVRGLNSREPALRNAGVIAQHYQLAGQEGLAAEYYGLAGEYSRGLYANVEAVGHFRLALALGHADAARLHEAIGDLETLLGDYGAGLASYNAALALAAGQDVAQPDGGVAATGSDEAGGRAPVQAAVLEHKLGMLHLRRGEWDLAAVHLQDALAALGEDCRQAALRAHLLADWSLAAHRQGHDSEALDLARRAQATARQEGDDGALAQAENALGMLARRRGDLAEACRHLETSLGLAESLGDMVLRAAALNNLALAYADSGDHPRAVHLAQSALALEERLGDRHRQAALHNNLADLLHAQGEHAQAMTHLKQAVAIFAAIRTEASDNLQPEIWKLTEW